MKSHGMGSPELVVSVGHWSGPAEIPFGFLGFKHSRRATHARREIQHWKKRNGRPHLQGFAGIRLDLDNI